jgi:serine/threonine protein kinase/formylglycine-generating enzyme required for sulfatase activity
MSEHQEALALFERFLERHHAGTGSLAGLCAEHPQHAERFERWWRQLARAGEVGAPEPAGDASCFGPYRLLRELGRGAQGVVHLALDQRLNRQVALKLLPAHRALGADLGRRFAREAELASRLDDPRIVTIHERGEIDGTLFLAMRHVDGETLAAALARAQRAREGGAPRGAVRLAAWGEAAVGEKDAIARLVALFEQVARALHVAHEARLIHRDVKPGNVLVDRAGQPVLVDFGLARDLEEPALTVTGSLVGTPAYMAPEQLVASRIPLDARADVYSLAATIYECLAGERPFQGATQSELLQEILTAEPPPLRSRNRAVPRDLEVVVLTGLEKDRRRRYQTALDLAEDLRRVGAGEPIRARPAPPWRRWARSVARHPVGSAVTALLIASLCIALVASLAWVREAQRARTAFQRLDDGVLLAEARREAEALYPVHREHAARFAAWIARYPDPLRARLAAHRAELAALRDHALPADAAADAEARARHPLAAERARVAAEVAAYGRGLTPPFPPQEVVRPFVQWRHARWGARLEELDRQLATVRAWRFASPEQRAAHDALAALVAELEAFLAPDGLAARVAHDGAAALDPRRAPDAAAWAAVRERLGQDARFAKVTLPPQEGLVPIGRDPACGLEEFAVLGSGDVPGRGAGAAAPPGAAPGDALVLVLVPPGVIPGGDDGEDGGDPAILDAFFAGKHELTRGQWRRLFAEPAPGHDLFAAGACAGDEFPVDSVSWEAVTARLRRHRLAVPTEAQWEHAARGGSLGRHWWGIGQAPRTPPLPANLLDKSVRGDVGYDDGHALLAPAGTMRCNPYGLADVYGNVAEWCRESFLPLRRALERFEVEPGTGYRHVPSTGQRAVRGFSCTDHAQTAFERGLRHRVGAHESVPHLAVGVRVVRAVE